ncbi:AraC family transcriptional regulator [Paenibacillus xylanexedens]|uniref:AraC family transcriptional regulator n=1 Tax=Paenibacillus xylanexedens TaxID=528191 RepID=UPI001F33B737|nr:AraC family transcriptional regulator [Paenibacillus xylanexedens]MCF7758560.1 AraC family transcriptional regulator [Paenibacillus xylanexedens]
MGRISAVLFQLLSVLDQPKESENVAFSHLADSRHLKHSEKMMRWIEEHFEYEMRLDQMTAEVYLFKSYASRIFHQETGSSVTEHVKARRLQQAHLLLSLRQQHFRWRRLADVPDLRTDAFHPVISQICLGDTTALWQQFERNSKH